MRAYVIPELFALQKLIPPIGGRGRISASKEEAVEKADAADRLEITFSRTSRTAGSVGIKCNSRLMVS